MDAVCGLIDEGKEVLDGEELSVFTRVCSWEGSQPPKLTHGVRILTLVLFPSMWEVIHGDLHHS